jgi:hypothetical protein
VRDPRVRGRRVVERERRPRDALGTLPPFSRASANPMAIACLRDFTFAPLRPLLSVPRLRRRMALATVFDAVLPYFFRVPLRAVVVPLRAVALRERARRVAGMSTPGKKFRTLRAHRCREQFPDGEKNTLAPRATS